MKHSPFSALSGARIIQPMMIDYRPQMLFGTSLDDTLTATHDQPHVIGLDGNDSLTGNSDNNVLVGDCFNPDFLNAILNGATVDPPPDPTSKQGMTC
jgi:hypothetical protein